MRSSIARASSPLVSTGWSDNHASTGSVSLAMQLATSAKNPRTDIDDARISCQNRQSIRARLRREIRQPAQQEGNVVGRLEPDRQLALGDRVIGLGLDYQLTDADGATATATVNITVTPVNDDPIVSAPIADQTSNDSDPISLDVSANFTDVDGDTLTFSGTGLPPGLSINATGTISGTIDSSASAGGPYTVVVTADDGNGGTVTDTFDEVLLPAYAAAGIHIELAELLAGRPPNRTSWGMRLTLGSGRETLLLRGRLGRSVHGVAPDGLRCRRL